MGLYRYTRDVGSWRRRLVSLIVTGALTGATAALTACAALCAERVDHGAPHAGHSPACAPSQAEPRVSAARSCCPNCDVTPLVSIAAVRTDAGLWLAAPASALEAPFLAKLPARVAAIQGRVASVQSLARTPLVLRI